MQREQSIWHITCIFMQYKSKRMSATENLFVLIDFLIVPPSMFDLSTRSSTDLMFGDVSTKPPQDRL